MEHRTIRPQSEHHYGPPSLPSLQHITQQSPNHSLPHPPPPLPTSAHPHRPPSAPHHPYPPPPYGHQPLYTPTSRPDRPLENGFHGGGEGSGHATPVNVPSLDVQPAPVLHTPVDTSQPPSAASMHQPTDRHPEGPPSAPPGAYPHAAPFPPPPYNQPPVPIQIQHPEMPPQVEHGGYPVQHQPHPGYGMGPYGPYLPYTSNSSNGPKKKGHRASQACEKCRERKSKCDENRPSCQGCRDQNIECVYRDNIPSKTVDKNLPPVLNDMNDVLSRLPGQNQDLADQLRSMQERHNDWFERIERFMEGAPWRTETKREEITRMDTPAGEKELKQESFQTVGPISLDRSMSTNSQGTIPAHASSQFESKTTENTARSISESEPLPDFDEHTTAAHKLLYLWPTIRKMVSNSIAGQEDYVLNGEARGLLRLYGRGEADKPRNRSIFTYASQPDQLPAEEPAEAPPASPNLWDERAVLPTDSQTTDSFVDTRPLDLKDDTVWTLVERYKVHIHDLHPFLDFPTLQRYLPGFIERHRLSSYGPASPYAAANSESARKKRKRSEPYQNGVTDQYTQSSGSPSISSVNDTSLPAAITYLVLALGSVTDFQGYIPGPVPDLSSMPPPKIPFSPSATSRQSPASSWGAPTPPSHDGRSYGQSPAQSFDSPNPSSKGSRATNVDQIPGLNYYREACRIIGLHNDSNELTNAQARLLAGLYKGQLGRVQESWSWISDACRICRYQIRMHGLDKGNPAKYRVRSLDTWQGAYENTILITCWSALQLESDILAELDYPHSGLASVQDQIPYPSAPGAAVPLSNNRTMTPMQYYVLQLYLRKRLNQMHVNVYAKALPSIGARHMAATLRNNEDSLDGLRETYGWQDEEPPATDILEARVRGKFYGAKYICLRPYLDYVLHAMKEVRSGEALETLAKDAYGRPRHSDLKLYAAIATMTEEEIIERAKWCVESAILSTEAFDGVPGRLIMTNIVGTSHAQFSNMLVLSAAYHSGPPEIRDLIPPIRLKALLERTIKFISNLQLCSPTAKDDIKILNAIYRYSFGKSARLEPQDASGSFSSDMSV